MRRVVLILPEWLSTAESESFIRVQLPGLGWLVERGGIRRCSGFQIDEGGHGLRSGTPEAAWLGLDPHSLVLQDGPLSISALGADPPSGSVHFHLSLLSLTDGLVERPNARVDLTEIDAILEASKKLNTKMLTIVAGEQYDHGLVWEDGSVEMGSFPPEAVARNEVRAFLPEGDGENLLRRFIDDSVNLLSELELNRKREDNGEAPLNLWWPWGQGFRVPVPNLALRRGEVARVESNSMRLQGLARLCGYRHGSRSTFGWGVKTNLEQIMSSIKAHSATVALLDAFSVFRANQRWEEMEWFSKQLDERLLTPLSDLAREEPLQLTLLTASSDGQGLALVFQSGSTSGNTVPFDERALEDKRIPTVTVWDAVAGCLAG